MEMGNGEPAMFPFLLHCNLAGISKIVGTGLSTLLSVASSIVLFF